jgi:hypothetical protein
VLFSGCFSTIEPEVEVRQPPETLGNKAWVRGQVLLYRGPGDRLGMPDYSVSVEWRDPQGNEIGDDVVKTSSGGNFAAWSDDPRIAFVEIAALRCDFDPQNEDWKSPWDDSVTLRVVPGAEAHQTLIIYCGASARVDADQVR